MEITRWSQERVFYVSERVLKHAGHIPKKDFVLFRPQRSFAGAAECGGMHREGAVTAHSSESLDAVHPQPEVPPADHGSRLHRVSTLLKLGYSEARLAQYRVWLKPSGEQHFVYGNHVVKAFGSMSRVPAVAAA